MIFIMAVWLHLWDWGAVGDVSGPVSDLGASNYHLDKHLGDIYGLLS